jgi:hypothetical protein
MEIYNFTAPDLKQAAAFDLPFCFRVVKENPSPRFSSTGLLIFFDFQIL